MDNDNNAVEVLELVSEHSVDSVLIDNYIFHEMDFTIQKVEWLWNQMNRHKSLFSDFTRGDRGLYDRIICDPHTFWLEFYDTGNPSEMPIGVMYVTELNKLTDANIHLIFFAPELRDKAPICKRAIRYIFEQFIGLHRLTASFPVIYYNTTRLAKRVGFRTEGVRREIYRMKGKWIDEVTLGILASEVTDGRND